MRAAVPLSPPPLTLAELAQRWRISERQARARVAALGIPKCLVAGRQCPRYRPSDVEEAERRMAGAKA